MSSRNSWIMVAVYAVAVLAGQAFGQQPVAERTDAKPAAGSGPEVKSAAAVADIERAMRGREYGKAVELIDAALAGVTGDLKEGLMFRRGLALLYGDKAEEAVKQLEGQLAEFPTGPWAQKARFRKADAHVELKQFEAAEAIYAERVRELVGNDRKARIAQVYLDFAQDYFAPRDALIKPDYGKARTFYQKALELEPGGVLRDDVLYCRALCNQKLQQWNDAVTQYEQYLLEFDEGYRALRKMRDVGAALPAAAGSPGTHVLLAQLGLAESRLAAGQTIEARRVVQDLLTAIEKGAGEAGKDEGGRMKEEGGARRDSRTSDGARRDSRTSGGARRDSRTSEAGSSEVGSGEARGDTDQTVGQRALWIKGTYLLSKTYGLPTPADGESLTLGVQALQRIVAKHSDSKEAIQAAYDTAASYAHLGRYDEAIKAHRALIDRETIRPADDEANKLAEMLSQDALYNIGRLLFAQKKYADAIGVWNQYVVKYPTGANWSAAQRAIVDAEFQIGADAVTEEHFDDARTAWTAFLEKYPLDNRAAGILFQFGAMAFQEQERKEQAGSVGRSWPTLAGETPAPPSSVGPPRSTSGGNAGEGTGTTGSAGPMLPTPDWQEPINLWKKAVNKFPNTEEAGDAQFMIGSTLEHKVKNLEAAIEAFGKLTWSRRMAEAQQRIVEMKATRLRVLTERVFHTDEPAKVQVDVRNIEKLTVKVYRVDMEDYFRKSHSLGGVESLDLLLIDPDKTFDVAVEGYTKYKPITQRIDIPFEGPGVYAVNISNEKAPEPAPGYPKGGAGVSPAGRAGVSPAGSVGVSPAGRAGVSPVLEATTLLIRSDIDVIIKSSRRQVLVFAENMRTQTPAAGVRVLVSDGKKVVLEGKTGDDGVWHQRSDEIKDLAGLQVFAVYEGHVAGDSLSLGGLGFATGLQPRGYLYTDRPTYQPGQAVNIRGVLREVKDGQFCLPAQPEDERLRWKLDVVDAKGRVLRTERLKFSDYGSFATQFRVASDAPVGEYKLIARRVEGPTFDGVFQVQTYQLPKAFLRWDFKDRVVMRGERITGSIVALYHYGEPVVGKTVEYEMRLPTGDALKRSGVTDKDGKVPFEFESTLLPEEGVAWFGARQADLDIGTASEVFVAVRAFRSKVRTVRPLYLSEEPVEAVVETKDLMDKPIAQDVTLTALLRTESNGQWAETKVESVPVKTAADTGEGRASLKLTKGGTYVLRAEGQDKFGHVVTAETMVQVSDDKDKTKLRLFSDRENYKVGEMIALDIHSRVERKDEGGGRKDEDGARVDSRASEGARNDSRGSDSARKDSRTSEPLSRDPIGERDDAHGFSRNAEGTRDSFLALITTIGEDVISYKTVMITKGHNQLDLPVGNEHFPNFAVEAAVMAGNRFYAASRDFTVERELKVTLKPDKATYRPRDKMTVEVTVTDQQGKPAAAEIGLAMIDDALLARFPDRTENIVTFFKHGAHRSAEMRTRTSCNFRYDARTREMVTELLAEGRRMEEINAPVDTVARRGTSVFRFDEGVKLQDMGGEQPASEVANLSPEQARQMIEQMQQGQQPAASGPRMAGPGGGLGGGRYLRGGGGAAGAKEPAQAGAAVQTQDVKDKHGQARRLFGKDSGGGEVLGFDGDTPPAELAYGLEYQLGEREARGGAWHEDISYPKNFGQQVQLQVDELNRAYATNSLIVTATPETLARIETLAKQMTEVITQAPPRTYYPEVAYWNPRVVTDADGKATVKITLPDSSTKWKLVARGVTVETLAGQGDAEVVCKHDFVADIITPPTLVAGDKFEPTAQVHCLTPYKGKIDVTLRAGTREKDEGGRMKDEVHPRRDSRTSDAREDSRTSNASEDSRISEKADVGNAKPTDRSGENARNESAFADVDPAVVQSRDPWASDEGAQREIGKWTKTIDADGTGVFDVVFDQIEVPDCGQLVLEVTATTQGDVLDAKRPLSDAVARALPVRPWGMRIEEHASGVLTDTNFVEIDLPSGKGAAAEYHDRQLVVAVGPSIQRWLIEEALEQGPRWAYIERTQSSWKICPPRTHADTASSLLAALYAADYLRAQRQSNHEGHEGHEEESIEKAPASDVPGRSASEEAGGVGVSPAPDTGKMPVPQGKDTGETPVPHNPEGTADARVLDERIAGLVAQLLSAQNDDGGWAWGGKGAESDPWTTAFVAWAIGKAKNDAGCPVADAARAKLLEYLKKTFADVKPGQTELKAITLHGISWLETADFAHANRLYRNRQSLSSAGLGYLALVFQRLDRKSIAAELLAVLDERVKEARRGEKQCRMLPSNGHSAWMNSELEVTALALLAQLSVDPKAGSVQPMVDYLVGSARADGWQPHKAKGTVLAALATYYAHGQQQREAYKLAISVNGKPVREVTANDAGSVRIDLAEGDLVAGEQRVDFAFSGRGEIAYAVTLSGFARQFPAPDSTRNNVIEAHDRAVFPPPPEYKGRVVPVGFSIAEDYKDFHNEAKNVPVASVVAVSVPLWRHQKSDSEAGDRDYIVVQETIPAGFRLLTETMNGNYLAWDYSDNVLTLYFGSRQGLNAIYYKMVATTPGTYRLPPTVIRSLYRPEIMRVNKSDQRLTVLPRGTKSPDEYKMTPDELYALGKLYFNDGDHAGAAGYLKQLLAGPWGLRDEPYRESIRMLLDTALARGNADETVNYFEILKEKYPDLVIPFEKIVRVAEAYGSSGQHERAYLVYRATADASFVRDANVGNTLQEEGRFLESIDYLASLWRDYPDTPQVESVYYAISQALYSKAENPATVGPRRGPGEAAGRVTRAAIIGETIRLLEDFLALYPESPSADEASYSLANAYLDLDDFKTVIARTDEMTRLFPESKWLDRYRYAQALAYFNLGDFAKALGLAEQVAAATYRDDQGVVRASPNKWLALYIIGQIYHAQQQMAKAIEFYKQVKTQFSDADEAVNYFEQKEISLPEVAIFHPDQGGFREANEWAEHLRDGGTNHGGHGEHGVEDVGKLPTPNVGSVGVPPARDMGSVGVPPASDTGGTPVPQNPQPPAAGLRGGAAKPEPRLYAKPYVDITYRNIKTAVLQVYRVDLMKLALVEKNLSHIAAVNLAGIKPIVETTVTLGDGHDYIDKSLRVELELSAAPTARLAATPKASAPPPAQSTPPGQGQGLSAGASPGQGRGLAGGLAGGLAESGAYLVICRGDDMFASGLVLVTPLAVEVQEDLASQRARVSVVNAIDRSGTKNVHVKVIGTSMSEFVSGDTDLRGMFIADAVSGYPTAIARDADGHFAFYRSAGTMLAMVPEQPPQVEEAAGKEAKPQAPSKADYRKHLMEDNRAIQVGNQVFLNDLMRQQQRGVEVQKAYETVPVRKGGK